jgi:hypothetical protein
MAVSGAYTALVEGSAPPGSSGAEPQFVRRFRSPILAAVAAGCVAAEAQWRVSQQFFRQMRPSEKNAGPVNYCSYITPLKVGEFDDGTECGGC